MSDWFAFERSLFFVGVGLHSVMIDLRVGMIYHDTFVYSFC